MRFTYRLLSEAFWLLVAVAVVAGGWFGFQTLGANRQVVEAQPVTANVPLVSTEPVTVSAGTIPIKGTGFLRAEKALDIAPEVGGRIIELHPAIESRGAFSAGEVLFRLDDRQARASIAQIQANIDSAEAQRDLIVTQLERSRTLRERGIIAQDQLDQLETNLLEIDASLRSQRANLDAQNVALDNTIVAAPFDGRVLEKLSDLGAVIAQGAPVAQIYSASDMEVEVSLRNEEAALIVDLFDSPKAEAFVETEFAGATYQWAAQITRVDRQIDSQTRTIDIVLRLDDPENGSRIDAPGAPVPALVNAYVQTRIEAQGGENIYVAQSQSVRAGDIIWTADNGQLETVPVDVLYRDGATVYFSAPDLTDDAQIITSQLATATDGMEIETVEQAAMATVSEGN